MPEYELTVLAEKDLKSIARYTIDKWGLQQAKRYETLLANRFQQIAHSRITPRVFSITDKTCFLPIVSKKKTISLNKE